MTFVYLSLEIVEILAICSRVDPDFFHEGNKHWEENTDEKLILDQASSVPSQEQNNTQERLVHPMEKNIARQAREIVLASYSH